MSSFSTKAILAITSLAMLGGSAFATPVLLTNRPVYSNADYRADDAAYNANMAAYRANQAADNDAAGAIVVGAAAGLLVGAAVASSRPCYHCGWYRRHRWHRGPWGPWGPRPWGPRPWGPWRPYHHWNRHWR